MKKTYMMFCIIAFCLLCLATTPAVSSNSEINENGITRKFGSIIIRIDPRIELLTAAQLLCDDYRHPNGKPIVGGMESSYKRDALAYFSNFKSQKVVNLTEQMSEHAFWYSHPLRAVLCRGSLPDLEPRYEPDGLLLAIAGGNDKLDEYFSALSDFAGKSSFDEFFFSQAPQYKRMIETFFTADRRNYPQDIEEFFGTTQKEYNLIFSPLNDYCGYGHRILTADNEYTTFVVVGPKGITTDSLPDFGWEQNNIFWHEFSHPHVNHIVEANIDKLIGPCTHLQTVKPEELEQYGLKWGIHIADWVSEHVVRATEACMMAKYEPGKNLTEFFEIEKKQGFPYVSQVYEALKRFDGSRDRYPVFEDFFPEIVGVFEQIAAVSRTKGEENNR